MNIFVIKTDGPVDSITSHRENHSVYVIFMSMGKKKEEEEEEENILPVCFFLLLFFFFFFLLFFFFLFFFSFLPHGHKLPPQLTNECHAKSMNNCKRVCTSTGSLQSR